MSFKAGLQTAGLIPTTHTPTPNPNTPIYIPTGDGTRDRTYAEAALQDECNRIATTPPNSGRNGALNTAAFNMARFINANIITKHEVHTALAAAAAASGLPETEIRYCLQGDRHQQKSAEKLGNKAPVPESTLEPIAPAFTIDPADILTIPEDDATPEQALEQPEPSNTRRRTLDLDTIEQGFWTRRPALATIYTTALSRGAAPWAVLAHCVARTLTQISPSVTLPPTIGGDAGGSLNWFACLVAKSGGGKDTAKSVAHDLIDGDVYTKPLGSGEGIVAAFGQTPTADDGDDSDYHPNIMFVADEVDTMTALGNRSGSTTMGILRGGFSGGTLGFSYKNSGTPIREHTYRMTLVMSVQPSRSSSLTGDGGGGTPQRFMWFPATDSRIPDGRQQRRPIAPLPRATVNAQPAFTYIDIPEHVEDFVWAQHVARQRGEGEAIDGHAVFCREKFAYALAVLDGRTSMNDADWELSGIAADVSTATYEWMITLADEAAREEAEARGQLRGVEFSAADVERAKLTDERNVRMGRWILKKLAGGPMTEAKLKSAANSKNGDRTFIGTVLLKLQLSNAVVRDGDLWRCA